MVIDDDNYRQGNLALSQVLLLYWHIVQDGHIGNDCTVFVDRELFDPFEYLDVRVEENCMSADEQQMLREGAVVHLLCDFNDKLCEYDEHWHLYDHPKAVLAAFAEGRLSAVPECAAVFRALNPATGECDLDAYSAAMRSIYERCVRQRFRTLAERRPA